MPHHQKLFLYSLALSDEHAAALARLVGKSAGNITFALIENAADVVKNSSGWVEGIRDSLKIQGFQIEQIDLREWWDKQEELHEKLSSKDVIWLGGGNTFYLRWILKQTGADEIIRALVVQGKVYAGWSAGAIVAGPTLQYFDAMDDPKDAPERILDGLHLTDTVIVPHIDNKDFIQGAHKADHHLRQAGYHTLPLDDSQALLIHGDEQNVI